MTITLEFWGGPHDGATRQVDLHPTRRPAAPLPGYPDPKMRVDERGRPNPTLWVTRWPYPTGGRRGWCRLRCKQDGCPNHRRPAPPPPAG